MILVAASARRHPDVPPEHERQIVWVIAEPPRNGYFRCVIDVDGERCWPRWRKVYQSTVELMNPEQYPMQEWDENWCRKGCGRSFRRASYRVRHESACGHESRSTLWERKRQLAMSTERSIA